MREVASWAVGGTLDGFELASGKFFFFGDNRVQGHAAR